MTNDSFPIATKITWTARGDEQTNFEMNEKMVSMREQGRVAEEFDVENLNGQIVITRYWKDTDSANEWISFLKSLNISALIAMELIQK